MTKDLSANNGQKMMADPKIYHVFAMKLSEFWAIFGRWPLETLSLHFSPAPLGLKEEFLLISAFVALASPTTKKNGQGNVIYLSSAHFYIFSFQFEIYKKLTVNTIIIT